MRVEEFEQIVIGKVQDYVKSYKSMQEEHGKKRYPVDVEEEEWWRSFTQFCNQDEDEDDDDGEDADDDDPEDEDDPDDADDDEG